MMIVLSVPLKFFSQGLISNLLLGILFKIEEEERRLEAAIEATERQNAEVNAELRELELKSSRFNELEERYVFLCTLTVWYFLIKNAITLNKISMNINRSLIFSYVVCVDGWMLDVNDWFYVSKCVTGIGMSSTIFSFN